MRIYQWLLSGLALATLPDISLASNQQGFYFELEFEQQRIELRDQNRLDTYTLGIRYREYWSPRIRLEMKFGHLGLDHETPASSSDNNLGGYYAGLGMNSSTTEAYRLQAGLNLSYSYYDSNDDQQGSGLEIKWTQAEAKLWLALRLNAQAQLFACMTTLTLDGRHYTGGTTQVRTNLENRDDISPCAGLRLTTTDHGFIGIEANSGAKHGGRIYFGRRF